MTEPSEQSSSCSIVAEFSRKKTKRSGKRKLSGRWMPNWYWSVLSNQFSTFLPCNPVSDNPDVKSLRTRNVNWTKASKKFGFGQKETNLESKMIKSDVDEKCDTESSDDQRPLAEFIPKQFRKSKRQKLVPKTFGRKHNLMEKVSENQIAENGSVAELSLSNVAESPDSNNEKHSLLSPKLTELDFISSSLKSVENDSPPVFFGQFNGNLNVGQASVFEFGGYSCEERYEPNIIPVTRDECIFCGIETSNIAIHEWEMHMKYYVKTPSSSPLPQLRVDEEAVFLNGTPVREPLPPLRLLLRPTVSEKVLPFPSRYVYLFFEEEQVARWVPFPFGYDESYLSCNFPGYGRTVKRYGPDYVVYPIPNK